jgi:hypothetical protein
VDTDPAEPAYRELLLEWTRSTRSAEGADAVLSADAETAEQQGNFPRALALLEQAALENPKAAYIQNRLDDAPARTTFAFEPISVSGIEPRWGSPVAPGFVVGGVDRAMRVQEGLFALSADDDGVHATALAPMSIPRSCACALFDERRRELVIFGGRDGDFADAKTAEIVNVDTGAREDLDVSVGAADHPVGCQAFWSPATDKGYVFGGLDSSSGFTDATWRYDPATRTVTALDIDGPAARYDAGVHVLDDGDAILVGGMGANSFSARFFSDVWRFDVHNERWTEVPTTSTTLPEGRRYPWTSLAPDESLLLYGFGSDSPRGESVLGDLWIFSFDTGEWAPLDVDGELPAARGFTNNWEGPEGTVARAPVAEDAPAARAEPRRARARPRRSSTRASRRARAPPAP